MNFDDLTFGEQKILTVFIKLISDIGRRNSFTFFKKINSVDGGYCIYKENDKWIAYTYEKGQIFGYSEYNDLYCLCLNIFSSLEKHDADYCFSFFPRLVQDIFNDDLFNKARYAYMETERIQNMNQINSFEEDLIDKTK